MSRNQIRELFNTHRKLQISRTSRWTQRATARESPLTFAQIMTTRTIAIIAAVLAVLWPLVVSPIVTTVVRHMFRYGIDKDHVIFI